jgi:hypothetical protein
MSLAFHTPMIAMYEKYIECQSGIYSIARVKSLRGNETSIGSPLLFTRDVTRVKTIRRNGTSIRSHLLFVRIGSLTVRAIESKPLVSIRDAYLYFGQSFTDHQNAHKCSSPCTVPGVTL